MGKAKGNCTSGPGLLAHRGICSEEELARKVSADSVNIEYSKRVAETERLVKRNIRVPLTQAQYDALVSLTYNAGIKVTRNTYDLINQGNFQEAATNISRMVKVEINESGKKKYVTAPALIARRADESAPFRAANPVATTKK